MDRYITLLFFGFSFSSCSDIPPRTYYYIDQTMNWTDAQRYCREKYTDLATVESMDDINRMEPTFYYSWSWLGLKDDPKSWKGTMGSDANSWRWTTTGELSKSSYSNWMSHYPSYYETGYTCVMMGPNGEWFDEYCPKEAAFICYTVTAENTKLYAYYWDPRAWDSALAYCRSHHTDLAMIDNSVENSDASSLKPDSVGAWIGLYREPWTWSDGSQSSFRSWRSDSPNNIGGDQHCVSENSIHEWDDDSCEELYVFTCHKDSKLQTMMKMTMVTDADLTDPAVNSQLLQQLSAALTSRGLTGFKLHWKIQPRKIEEEYTETSCKF